MPRVPWPRSTSRRESADKSGMRAGSASTVTNRDVRAASLGGLVDRDCSDRKRGHPRAGAGRAVSRAPASGTACRFVRCSMIGMSAPSRWSCAGRSGSVGSSIFSESIPTRATFASTRASTASARKEGSRSPDIDRCPNAETSRCAQVRRGPRAGPARPNRQRTPPTDRALGSSRSERSPTARAAVRATSARSA